MSVGEQEAAFLAERWA